MLLLLSLSIFATSCNSGSEEVPVEMGQKRINLPANLPVYDSIPKPETLAGYAWTNAEKRIVETGCGSRCSNIGWKWFTLSQAPSPVLIDSVQRYNWYYLTGIPGAREIDLDSIAASFFKEAQKEVSDSSGRAVWTEGNSVWPVAATANTFTIGGFISGSYGGPSQNYASNLDNFNIASGRYITLKDLVAVPFDIFAVGEAVFRKQKGVTEGTSLINAGFRFPEDVFYLPETFGILPDGLLFVYVPEEVVSYTEGEQYLFIPYSLIADQLKPEYQYLAKAQ